MNLSTLKDILTVASIEAKRSGKNKLSLICDIVVSRFKHGTIVCDYMAYGFSMIPKEYRKEYFSSHQLIRTVNKVNNRSIDSKWTSYQLLKEYYKRDIVHIEESSQQEVSDFLQMHQQFFTKTLDGSGGFGVVFFDQEKEKVSIENLKEKKLVLLEQAIIQHDDLNYITDSCINTLRVVSVLSPDGTVAFLPSILRVGGGTTKVDNVSSGGTYTLLDEQGVIMLDGLYQENLEHIKNKNLILKYHPVTKVSPYGLKVPFYHESLLMVEEMARKIPDCPIVGWDIAIAKNGPKLLEFNSFPGLDMNQNYYFTKILNKEHVGAKSIIEKQLGIQI